MNYVLFITTAIGAVVAAYFYNLSKKRTQENFVLQAKLIAEEVRRLGFENGSLEMVNELFIKYQKTGQNVRDFTTALGEFFIARFYERVGIEEIIRFTNEIHHNKKYDDKFVIECKLLLKYPEFHDDFCGKVKSKIKSLVEAKDPHGAMIFHKILKTAFLVDLYHFELTQKQFLEDLYAATRPPAPIETISPEDVAKASEELIEEAKEAIV